MSEVLTSDIFFFITAAAIVVVTILLVIVLIYLIRILKDINTVSHTVKEGTEVIADDAKMLRSFLKRMFSIKAVAALTRTVVDAAAKIGKGRKTKD